MMTGKNKALVLLIGTVVLSVVFMWWSRYGREGVVHNPLIRIEKKEKEVKVFGFLPSWMVGKTRIYGKELDRLIFLGVEANEKGELVWDTQGNKINNPKYIEVKENVRKSGGKNIIGIRQFDDDVLDKMMTDEEVKNKLVNEIKGVVTAGNFDGVNVDFEYQKSSAKVLEPDFLSFIKKLKEADVGEISVDVFANTVIKGEKSGLTSLLEMIDHLIVMGYDFHRPGVSYAGPVAPVGSPLGKRNLTEVTERIGVDGLDKSKMILAFPLYGYEWKTETEDFGSKVKAGWSQMASFARAGRLASDASYKIYDLRETESVENVSELKPGEMKLYFDKVSMSPWLVYKTETVKTVQQRISKYSKKTKAVTVREEQIFQVYYEDLKSLGMKLQMVKDNKLAGVGFWALGYEGEDENVWKTVRQIIAEE